MSLMELFNNTVHGRKKIREGTERIVGSMVQLIIRGGYSIEGEEGGESANWKRSSGTYLDQPGLWTYIEENEKRGFRKELRGGKASGRQH